MKIIQLVVLILVLTTLLVGCASVEKASNLEEKGAEDEEPAETGISDVFEDTGEISPPQTPD